jgi:polyisoprenoid-binding protein YceI
MKKLFVLTMMAALVFACNPKNAMEAATGDAKKASEASGAEYKVVDGSVVHWRGVKPTGEHMGTVNVSDGMVTVMDGMPSAGSVTIDLNSIVNSDLEGDMNGRLVGHLKSEDFFHTAEYPTAKFEIVSLKEYSGDGSESELELTHELTGNLTMRGESKSISFPAAVSVMDGMVSVKTAEFSIDRTLWGVNFKSKKVFAELKDDFINDMINMKFDVTFKSE